MRRGIVATVGLSLLIAIAFGAGATAQDDGGSNQDPYVVAAEQGTVDELAEDSTKTVVIDGTAVDGLHDIAADYSAAVDVNPVVFYLAQDATKPPAGKVPSDAIGVVGGLYGDAISSDVLQSALPLITEQLVGRPDSPADKFSFGEPRPVEDPFGVPIGLAWNFRAANGSEGYVVLTTHTRSPLVLDFQLGGPLSVSGTLELLGPGQVYALSDDGSATARDGSVLTAGQFEALAQDRRARALAMSSAALDALEQQTKVQLNNVNGIAQTGMLEEDSAASYAGQDADSAYANYGRIYDIPAFLANRYGATSITRTSYKNLAVTKFLMTAYGPSNDCVAIAITRTFWYYEAEKGYTRLSPDRSYLYNSVLTVATKWGFSESGGTNPVNIDNIMSEVATYYGYGSTTKGIYLYSFNGTVKSEIDQNRPLLLNMDQGSYANHTVTINGYSIYSYKVGSATKTRVFLNVVDSWKEAQRYIDFDLMGGATLRGTLASLNTMTLNK